MSVVKSYPSSAAQGPSLFAMLVDNIRQMSASEQKVLWLQLNKQKIGILAKELDAGVVQNELSPDDINALIAEAKSYARKKKG